MVELLVAVLVTFVALVAATGFVAWRVFRLVRARLRWGRQVRVVRMWTAPPGPRREVAYLRAQLADAITRTPQAVAMVKASAGVVGDLPSLTKRLERVATVLDAELRLLANEPDVHEVARVLPAARERVGDLTRAARGIRRAAGGGLGVQTAAEMRELSADVEREVAAVAAGVERLVVTASTG
jgi:hypothetical protein